MAYEIHSGLKTAHPRRAFWTAILLFAGTVALAMSMTISRRADPLGSRIAPAGWPMSFRSPRSFGREEHFGTPRGPAIRLLHISRRMQPIAVITVRFIPSVHGVLGQELALTILEDDGMDPNPPDSPARRASETTRMPLGPLDGFEARDHDGSTVTRAAIGPGGGGFAVTLSVVGTAIGPDLYRVFDLVCRSVESGRTGP